MRINWQIAGWSAGAVAFAAVVATAAAIGPVWAPQTQTPVSEDTGVHLIEPAAPVAETPAPTPTPTAAPVPVAETAAPVPPPAPEPIRCPAGSTANSSDGVNDTSCYPTICYSILVPDPAHPECDKAFKP